MMLIPSELKSSPIHGIGIYTTEAVLKGTLIWRLEPDFERLLDENIVKTWPQFQQDFVYKYSYPHPKNPSLLILEVDNGRFMNHSLTPNTDFNTVYEGYALIDLPAGTEMTCNYNEFHPGFVMTL
ncbi:MAG: SET domain-containing protein-lysine N-methyltransferase [Rickettsiales bacterium]|nr:SET domain-containing protein-lysine N-methyltransferase [Rickettsiales bacterium]